MGLKGNSWHFFSCLSVNRRGFGFQTWRVAKKKSGWSRPALRSQLTFTRCFSQPVLFIYLKWVQKAISGIFCCLSVKRRGFGFQKWRVAKEFGWSRLAVRSQPIFTRCFSQPFFSNLVEKTGFVVILWLFVLFKCQPTRSRLSKVESREEGIWLVVSGYSISTDIYKVF